MRLESFIPLEQTSQTNRPLNESNDDPDFVRHLVEMGVDLRTQTWHFGGSREGHQYKGPAMSEIVRSFPSQLCDFALYHFIATGGNGKESNVGEVQTMADIGLALPFYLFNRARNPIRSQGELPAHIAGGFKVCSGFMKGIKGMRTRYGDDILTQVIPADEYYEYFEDTRTLVDAADFACAAPKPMIERAAEALVNGDEEGMKASLLLQDPDLDLGDLVAFTPLYDELRNHIYAFKHVGRNYTTALVNGLTTGKLTAEQILRILKSYQEKETQFQENVAGLFDLIAPTLGYSDGTQSVVSVSDLEGILPVGPRRVVRARYGKSLDEILK